MAFLDKLFDGEAESQPTPGGEDQTAITISQYAQDKMRDRLSESEEISKSPHPHAARRVERFFNSMNDGNLLFEAHKLSIQKREGERFARQRQDIMRDLQRNYAFLDTLQNRRQTISGHVTTVMVSNDTKAED